MRRYNDTIVLGCPIPADEVMLTMVAMSTLRAHYPRSTLLSVHWTIVTTMDEVDAWPLPHDCDECRDGKVQAIRALAEGTTPAIALGNMLCEEPDGA